MRLQDSINNSKLLYKSGSNISSYKSTINNFTRTSTVQLQTSTEGKHSPEQCVPTLHIPDSRRQQSGLKSGPKSPVHPKMTSRMRTLYLMTQQDVKQKSIKKRFSTQTSSTPPRYYPIIKGWLRNKRERFYG